MSEIRHKYQSYKPLIDGPYRYRVSQYTHPEPQRLALELVDDLGRLLDLLAE